MTREDKRTAALVSGILGGARDALLEERDRWLLWVPVAFGAGIGLYFILPDEPPVWLAFGPGALSITCGWLCRRRPVVLFLSVGLFIAASGFLSAQWHTLGLKHPVLAESRSAASLQGRIVLLEPFPDGVRVTLDRIRIQNLAAPRQPPRVRVRLRGAQPALAAGDWIEIRAVLSPPPPPVLPGGFDLQRQFYFQELAGVGFALGRARIVQSHLEEWRFAAAIERLRWRVTQRVVAAIPGDAGTVAAALITGQRTIVREPVLEAFRASGIAHLLAISGLHIGLVAGFIFVIVRGGLSLIPAIALPYPIKKWAAVAAVIGAFAYALLAGATVPTQRAFLMIGLVLVAIVLDRQGISMRSVAWAALVILALTPAALLSASFQMSFAAVVALIAVYEWISRRASARWALTRRWWRGLPLYFGGVVLTTIVASAATGPFAVYHFNRIAVLGLVANLVAVPLTAFLVMPLAVLALIAMPLGLDGIFLAAMGWGVGVIIHVAERMAALPGASLGIGGFSTIALIAVASGGIWLCLWQRKWRLLGVPLVLIGVLAIPRAPGPDLLVDGEARLFGVVREDGRLALSSVRASRFAGSVWLRAAGQIGEAPAPWPARPADGADDLVCDALACIYHRARRTIALVRDSLALEEECRRADIVVATVPVRGRICRTAALVIDRFDLWREGAHALWISESGISVKTVQGERGARPWVLRRPRGGI